MSRIWLIGGGTLVAALLVASIVVVVIQGEEELKEGTPERTVQLYLKAVVVEDFNAAYSFLSTELKRECSLEEYLVNGSVYGSRELERSRVTLQKTSRVNGTVIVRARVTRVSSSGPFGVSESSHDQDFTLREEDGEWRFTRMPWPYYGCGASYRPPEAVPLAPAPASTPAPTSQ